MFGIASELSAEINNLNKMVETLSQKEIGAKTLDEAITKLTLALQDYEKIIEGYADFLETGVARKHLYIEEMEQYANDLEAGVLRKQDAVVSGEKYADRLEVGAAKTQEFAREMEAYANRLETGVAERMKELAEIGTAVAGLSHCIKNIANNLKAGSFVVEQGLAKEKYDLVKKGWSILGGNIQKMSDLAMDMLVYSKKRTPDYEDVDLNSLINEIVDFVNQQAVSRNIRIVRELNQNIEKIRLEPKGIYRCLLNLISNGIDACQDKKDGRIRIRSSMVREHATVRIDISDNGCGMDEETRKKLFTSFFSTKGSKGTGLGLPTTYKIIKEHKGMIAVASEIGKGTTVSVELPMKPENAIIST